MDNFTSKDICLIIKACSQAGVTELKLSNLDIKFDKVQEKGTENPQFFAPTEQPSVSPYGAVDIDPRNTPDTPTEQASAVEGSQLGIMTSEQKEVLEEMRMSQMMMDDPEAYENAIVDGYMNQQREAGLGKTTGHRGAEHDLL